MSQFIALFVGLRNISRISIIRFLLLFLFCFILKMPVQAATVGYEVVHSQDQYPAGGTYPILIQISIADAFYIHGTLEVKGEAFRIPTVLTFQKFPGIEIKDIQFSVPEQKEFEYSEAPKAVYSGRIWARVLLQVADKISPGQVTLKGALYYQACTANACLPPEEIPVRVQMIIAAAGTPAEKCNQEIFSRYHAQSSTQSFFPGADPEISLLLALGFLFVSGMALNLTPCIYPLIPITVSYFGGMSNEFRGKTLMHGLMYILGLSITNSVLGTLASFTGSMVGTLLQNPWVLIAIAAILLFLALSFFGLWEVRLPLALTRATSRNFGGYFGTFFMGLTLGIVAAPCLGPFILALLAYAAKVGDPFLGFLYFFVLSLGIGLPLAVLAVFSGGVSKLPVSGGWLIWIKKVLGWVLVGMAAYVLFPLIHSFGGKTAVTYVAVFLTAAAGLHLGWLDRTDGQVRKFRYVKKVLGGAFIGLAISFFVFDFPGGKEESVPWVAYTPGLLEQSVQQNRPVIVDFSAAWCLPCRAMDKDFADPEVRELTWGITLIRVDLTLIHPHQEHLKERFNIKGVPTILFINADGQVIKDLTIESYVDKEALVRRIKILLRE